MSGRDRITGKLVSVQVGIPATRIYEPEANSEHREWTSAIFKHGVTGPVFVDILGLKGDDQADKRAHGGPDQAVMAYCANVYPEWKTTLNIPDLEFGSFGENLTISGLNEWLVCEEDIFKIGEVLLQVTRLRQPCFKQERRLNRPGLIRQIVENGQSGWYHRVLQTGFVEAGMTVELVDRDPDPIPLRG